MSFAMFAPAIILVLWCALAIWREPRRFGNGMLLFAVLLVVITALAGIPLAHRIRSDSLAPGWVLLVLVLLGVGLIMATAVFLLLNMVTMWRREGLGMAPRLSGMLGFVMLLYVALAVLAFVTGNNDVLAAVILLGLPAMYFGFLFVGFLLYSALYVRLFRPSGRAVDAVIVLGSGLGDGSEVTPLLAGRLVAGREVFERMRAAGRDPVLVTSGGKGNDELLAEGTAMADWLAAREFDRDRLLTETASTDTRENLQRSKRVLASFFDTSETMPASASGRRDEALIMVRDDDGAFRRADVAVATSNYHAFRAAVVMREERIPGYSVGAPTAHYFWPSATVREFFALLVEHSRWNLFVLAAAVVPFLLWIVNTVFGTEIG